MIVYCKFKIIYNFFSTLRTFNFEESDICKPENPQNLLFGTIDSWIIWKLTNGKVHATDFTNASRTLIFDITDKKWDQKLCDHFHLHCVIPAGYLSHDGERWIHSKKKFLFPVKALSRVYRGKFMELM